MSLEDIIINSSIEEHKISNLSTIDILGAYLHTELDKEVIMILKGRLEELLVRIDPKIYL